MIVDEAKELPNTIKQNYDDWHIEEEEKIKVRSNQ
jgi:hypothetical protein